MKRSHSHISVVDETLPSLPLLEEEEAKWKKQWNLIVTARNDWLKAPVDTMGCDRLYDVGANACVRRFQKLCSLILSAQSKDEKTKESMDNLLALPDGLTPQTILKLPLEELETKIRPSGLYRGKAKSLKGSAQRIIEVHGGDVPSTLKELLELPGVGPKIGALAMSVCWGRDESIGVDVHVNRITQRLGWVKGNKKNDAEFTRKALEEWLPSHLWRPVNTALVGLGQTLCTANNPKCSECPVSALCPSSTSKKV